MAIALVSFSRNEQKERKRCVEQVFTRSGLAGYVGVGLCPTQGLKIAKRPVVMLDVKRSGTEGSVQSGTRTILIILSPTICRRNLMLALPKSPTLKAV
jgi:hypothetical protein